MRKALIILGIILMIAAIKPAVTRYRTQISQYCGGSLPADFQAEQTARWLGEWWPHRGNDRGFALCVGPAEYISYRPFDVATVLAILGVGSLIVGLMRQRRGKA